jgi:Cache domain
MPFTPLEVKISLQRLLVAVILVIVPLNVVGFYLALQADTLMHQVQGAHFRAISRGAATLTAEFVNQRVADVGAITRFPAVLAAVTAGNHEYERMGTAAMSARMERIEGKWNTAEADTVVQKMLSSDVSQTLQHYREMNPNLLTITVSDQAGATIAATDRPLHYVQTNREYWQGLYGQGKGAIYITDVRYDEQTKAHYLGIGFPVLQEGTGRFAGAVNALVDVSTLFSLLNQEQIGSTGRVVLVRDDSTVVSATGVPASLKLTAEEYGAAREALATLRGRQTGYVVSGLPSGGNYLIGFADTGLKEAYPNLGWTIIASQEEGEAFGPVRNLARFAVVMTVLGLLMLTLLAAYVFMHTRERWADIEVAHPEQGRGAGAA